MRLNKNAQYALLLTTYICRAGTASLQTIAENLNLSIAFLEQTGRKLRVAGVLTAVRGPGGGYKINGNPTVGDVLRAVGTKGFLTQDETLKLSAGNGDQRTVAAIIGDFSWQVMPIMKRTIAEYVADLGTREVAQLENANVTMAN